MMYEYNGNLLEYDRIDLVANEIIAKYPQINIEKAKEIAMFEDKIDIVPNLEIMFNRLYNIMLLMCNDKNIVKIIYIDLISLLDNNRSNDRINYYYNIALEIANFLMDEREFPYLYEF